MNDPGDSTLTLNKGIELFKIAFILRNKRSPYACPLPSLSGLCPAQLAGYHIRPGSIPPWNRGFFSGATLRMPAISPMSKAKHG